MSDNKLADAYDRAMEKLVAQDVEIDRLTNEVEHLDGQIQTLLNENKKVRAALEEISSCVQLLGLDGSSDAPHVMNVIAKALANEQDK